MHLADALISPAVGGTAWAVAAGSVAYAARQLRRGEGERLVPLTGVLGAFIFAAQMLNFTLPGTGSSGHIGGGLLLAVLLGPHAALLTITSVLLVQALFFADGGLLALGCNILNLGVVPAWIAAPLVYRPLCGTYHARRPVVLASLAAAIAALQLGAGGVILETALSGVAALPIGKFALLLLPLHLAIGIVEGLATAAVVLFIARLRPDILAYADATPRSLTRPLFAFLAMALLLALTVPFASPLPDGLEWSLARLAVSPPAAAPLVAEGNTTGLLGGTLTLVLAGGLALAVRRRRERD